MIGICLQTNLPSELQMKISSYLYYSNQVSSQIKPILEVIKNYNDFHLTCLIEEHDTDLTLVSYSVLKYFLYDKIKSDKLCIDYTMLSKPRIFQCSELKRIFTKLRIIDMLRILKYIPGKYPKSNN